MLTTSDTRTGRNPRELHIGLVNNMPDAALARTEQQFAAILGAATSVFPVRMSYFAVPGIERSELGDAHLALRGYRSTTEMAGSELDAVIVTGAEPKAADLRDEPFWEGLSDVFRWIEREGPSAMFSCLAAHAAVLHFDGVERSRLSQKRFGLYGHNVVGNHAYVANVPHGALVPHSRWNEVSREALQSAGYQVLTESAEAGVELFLKQMRHPLLFSQGHPEYDSGTLFREFRRDVQRFLSGASDRYPGAPRYYFTQDEIELLNAFRERAFVMRDIALMQEFPVSRRGEDDSWTSPMIAVFRAWLLRIATTKALPAYRHTGPRFGGLKG